MSSALRAYVGTGSNLGDRAGNLLLALCGMTEAGLRLRRLSSVYETEPAGVLEEQPAFLNMVVELGGPLPGPVPISNIVPMVGTWNQFPRGIFPSRYAGGSSWWGSAARNPRLSGS